MAILKKREFGKGDMSPVETTEFIDLTQMNFETENQVGAKTLVKVAEIYRYEDLSKVRRKRPNGYAGYDGQQRGHQVHDYAERKEALLHLP